MKKVYQYEYDNLLKEIEELEKELAETRLYKGNVAIYQGDNWHDNPILYQTELKETALMAKIRNLKNKLMSYEVIKERDSSMISVEDILNPNIIKDLNISEEQKLQVREIQNYAISYPIDGKMIVNGKNGSGLEDIMLYRIAYLICSSNNKINYEDIILINPNEMYTEVINDKLSKFLPENIIQKSLAEFTSEYINEKISIYNEDERIEQVKLSENYQSLLDQFITTYLEDGIVLDDLKVCGEILFEKEEIKHALFNNVLSIPNYNWACMYFINKYKSKNDFLSDKLTSRYSNIYKSMSYDNPDRMQYVVKANEILKIFKERGLKIIKDYFKKLDRKISEIYSLFITTIPENFFGEITPDFKSRSLKLLKQHKVSVADISFLLYIKYKLTNICIDKKHMILSETQNYGNLMMSSIEQIFSNSGITFFRREDKSKLGNLKGYEVVNLSEVYEEEESYDLRDIKEPIVKKLKKQEKNG